MFCVFKPVWYVYVAKNHCRTQKNKQVVFCWSEFHFTIDGKCIYFKLSRYNTFVNAMFLQSSSSCLNIACTYKGFRCERNPMALLRFTTISCFPAHLARFPKSQEGWGLTSSHPNNSKKTSWSWRNSWMLDVIRLVSQHQSSYNDFDVPLWTAQCDM